MNRSIDQEPLDLFDGGTTEMPMYVYRCDKCGHKLELIRSIKRADEKPEDECPNCGTSNWTKVLHPTVNRYRFND
jgi:putative FmdB family regulatory protein